MGRRRLAVAAVLGIALAVVAACSDSAEEQPLFKHSLNADTGVPSGDLTGVLTVGTGGCVTISDSADLYLTVWPEDSVLSGDVLRVGDADVGSDGDIVHVGGGQAGWDVDEMGMPQPNCGQSSVWFVTEVLH